MSPRLTDVLLQTQSDERLVALARDGHQRAFALIVERYRGELHAFARRLRYDERAEDLVQQTLLSAFAALQAGAEVKHLRGWLYQILRNTAIRFGSQTKIEAELDPASIAGEPLEEAVQRRLQAIEVFSKLSALPATQRDALVATAFEGRSRASIAGSMGLSEGAVRQLVHRARASLRTAVTAITPWPLARRLAATPNGWPAGGVAELALGAGGASVGGVALKLGALVASAVVATGVATTVHFKGHRQAQASLAGARQSGSSAAAPGRYRIGAATVTLAADTRVLVGGRARGSHDFAGPTSRASARHGSRHGSGRSRTGHDGGGERGAILTGGGLSGTDHSGSGDQRSSGGSGSSGGDGGLSGGDGSSSSGRDGGGSSGGGAGGGSGGDGSRSGSDGGSFTDGSQSLSGSNGSDGGARTTDGGTTTAAPTTTDGGQSSSDAGSGSSGSGSGGTTSGDGGTRFASESGGTDGSGGGDGGSSGSSSSTTASTSTTGS